MSETEISHQKSLLFYPHRPEVESVYVNVVLTISDPGFLGYSSWREADSATLNFTSLNFSIEMKLDRRLNMLKNN